MNQTLSFRILNQVQHRLCPGFDQVTRKQLAVDRNGDAVIGLLDRKFGGQAGGGYETGQNEEGEWERMGHDSGCLAGADGGIAIWIWSLSYRSDPVIASNSPALSPP